MGRATPSYPLLAIDTSSRATWAGVKTGSNDLACHEISADPSESLFEATRTALRKAQVELDELSSIAYCEGPGSMLGARMATMAIRAWEGIGIPAASNLFAFTSLDLAGALRSEGPEGANPVLLVADARRNSWNVLPYPNPKKLPIRLVDNDELETLAAETPVFALEGFPLWTKTAAEIQVLPYDREAAFRYEAYLPCLRPAPYASPLSLRVSEYRKWEPKIHSATDPS